MEPKSRKLTNRASAATAVVAIIAQPIPAGDELILIPIHYWFVRRMARLRGVPKRDLPYKSIRKIIWYGAGARLVANFSFGIIPFLGAVANAVTAIALTEYLGRWLDAYLENPENPPPELPGESIKDLFKSAQKKAQTDGAAAEPPKAEATS